MKRCRRCGEEKELDEFHVRKRSSDGHQTWCKLCMRTYCGERNPRAGIERHGITVTEFDARLAAQGGVCAACGSEDPGHGRFDIDHDHACCPGTYSCGRCVRGLLCSSCNSILGLAQDDETKLERILKYMS